MKDRRIGERRTEKYTHWPSWYRERRRTIIKAGRRVGVEDRRSGKNYFLYGATVIATPTGLFFEERRKK